VEIVGRFFENLGSGASKQKYKGFDTQPGAPTPADPAPAPSPSLRCASQKSGLQEAVTGRVAVWYKDY